LAFCSRLSRIQLPEEANGFVESVAHFGIYLSHPGR
jgi:hypothetical protein